MVGGGVVPTGMSGNFKEDTWTAPTTIGGRWNWDQGRAWATAAVSVTNFTVSDAQLLEIDAKLDDGDLSTGVFRKIAANRVSYIIEP